METVATNQTSKPLGRKEDSMSMTPTQQREAAQRFVEQWRGHGFERQEAQRFWMQLSAQVLGIEDPFSFEAFDAEKRDAKGGFADVILPAASLLIEQKSGNVNLDEPEERQGRLVTPLTQALDYNNSFRFNERRRFICVCNFHEFRFYDLNEDPLAKKPPYAAFTLDELPENLHVFRALLRGSDRPDVSVSETRRVNVEAARHVATLNRHLARFYHHADTDEREHTALALTTVRLVFLYYAEDSGLLKPGQFTDYVESLPADWLGQGLQSLFDWVDKDTEAREQAYPTPALKEFPYIDGGLFHETVPVPTVNEDFKQALLNMGRTFDWSDISPVIFGSLMEETLSHDERRQGGMHYTSPENIHKLIDPLFLDELKQELQTLINQYDDKGISPQKRTALTSQLKAFQDRLAGLQFLDPACGSGNFLTETFLQLRALEDEILVRLQKGDVMLDLGEGYLDVKVNIRQFHGIEINGFACSVARTALWIAEQQALDRTEARLGNHYDRLPLTDSGDIICGNALQTDWNTLLPGSECDYVMGNPPFIGYYLMNDAQKQDMRDVFDKDYDGYLDYATAWYRKATDYLQNNPSAQFAFVSTNSITQGQPVPALFKPLFARNWQITFAHRTFQWDAQTTDNAHVHVVIIGMAQTHQPHRLYTYGTITSTPVETRPKNINAYLLDAPNVFVIKRNQSSGPLSPELSPVVLGSRPIDGSTLSDISKEECDAAKNDPIAVKYIQKIIGARELINQEPRWCLWLVDASPAEIRKSAFISRHVEACRAFRESSTPTTGDAYKLRDTPWLFRDNHQPATKYLAIPRVFSGRREYATCDWYSPDVIAGDQLYVCPDPNGVSFAIIESSMFITWQSAVGGRLKSDYRFGPLVVWNNLPLPALSADMRERIIAAGKSVLDARSHYPDSSLADLYDPLTMPPDLRKAHRELDKVVDLAFGASKPCESNEERLRILFDSYLRLTGERG